MSYELALESYGTETSFRGPLPSSRTSKILSLSASISLPPRPLQDQGYPGTQSSLFLLYVEAK